MLVLLSPAKDLALETPVIKGTTQPALLDDARRLVTKLKTLSAKKLADLMDLSLKLGELNKERYTRWHVPFTVKNARPAVFTFNGEVYRGLDARTLNDGDLRARMGAAGRSLVERHYSLDRMLDELERVYRRAAERAAGRA